MIVKNEGVSKSDLLLLSLSSKIAVARDWDDALQKALLQIGELDGVKHLGMVRCILGDGQPMKFKLLGEVQPIQKFSREIWQQVESALHESVGKNQDSTATLSSFVIDGRRLNLFVFCSDEHRQDWLVTEWRDEAAASQRQVEWLQACQYLASQFQIFHRLAQAESLLHRDDLTGLYNHRFLDASLRQEIKRTQRFQTSFCVLFIDLDDFKPINDQYGHLSGSGVLRQFADILRDSLREVDTIFRYGGDEFVVVLLETTAETGALAAERIRKRMAEHAFLTEQGKEVRVTCSIGVVACPEHGDEHEALLRAADFCMYKGKRTGKNQVIVAEPVARQSETALSVSAQRRVNSSGGI